MVAKCIVPSSPQKDLKRKADAQDGLRSKLSTLPPAHSTMAAHVRAGVADLKSVTATASGSGSAFRSGSALAQRDALKKLDCRRKTEQREYVRGASASFSIERVAGRDEALQVVEPVPVGPGTFPTDEKDPHFLKLEPNSGIALRKRYTAHQDFQGHLEGRTNVPISTLYSIAKPGKSSDGDFVIPIEGDWLVIGVTTSKIKRTVRKATMVDFKGEVIDEDAFKQRWHAYLQRKGDDAQSLADADNPYREVKETQPSLECITVTLTDLGQPLERNETAGDSQVELTVFQSEEVQRGSSTLNKDPFRIIEHLPLGAAVCVLNPMVKTRGLKQDHQKEQSAFTRSIEQGQWHGQTGAETKSSQDRGKLIRLHPRKGDGLLVIGLATHFRACGALCRDGQACENFVDARSRLTACAFHMRKAATGHRHARQEFANGTSSFASDGGMFGTSARTYVSQGSNNALDRRSVNPTSSSFRVEQRYGREKEWKRLQTEQMRAEDSMREQLQRRKRTASAAAIQKVTSDVLPPPTTQTDKPFSQTEGRSGHGAKAIDQAIQALTHARGVKHKVGEVGRTAHPSTASPVTQGQQSKLLMRHTAPAASLPKPVMRTRRQKQSRSAVRPPPGESFYACDSSDDELDAILARECPDSIERNGDDDSDLEIVR